MKVNFVTTCLLIYCSLIYRKNVVESKDTLSSSDPDSDGSTPETTPQANLSGSSASSDPTNLTGSSATTHTHGSTGSTGTGYLSGDGSGADGSGSRSSPGTEADGSSTEPDNGGGTPLTGGGTYTGGGDGTPITGSGGRTHTGGGDGTSHTGSGGSTHTGGGDGTPITGSGGRTHTGGGGGSSHTGSGGSTHTGGGDGTPITGSGGRTHTGGGGGSSHTGSGGSTHTGGGDGTPLTGSGGRTHTGGGDGTSHTGSGGSTHTGGGDGTPLTGSGGRTHTGGGGGSSHTGSGGSTHTGGGGGTPLTGSGGRTHTGGGDGTPLTGSGGRTHTGGGDGTPLTGSGGRTHTGGGGGSSHTGSGGSTHTGGGDGTPLTGSGGRTHTGGGDGTSHTGSGGSTHTGGGGGTPLTGSGGTQTGSTGNQSSNLSKDPVEAFLQSCGLEVDIKVSVPTNVKFYKVDPSDSTKTLQLVSSDYNVKQCMDVFSYKFNNGVSCCLIKCDNKEVWKKGRDDINEPKTMSYIKGQKKIMVSDAQKAVWYKLDNGSWKFAKVVSLIVSPKVEPPITKMELLNLENYAVEIKSLTGDPKNASSVSELNKDKYTVKVYPGNNEEMLYEFYKNTKCTQVKYRDHVLWSKGDNQVFKPISLNYNKKQNQIVVFDDTKGVLYKKNEVGQWNLMSTITYRSQDSVIGRLKQPEVVKQASETGQQTAKSSDGGLTSAVYYYESKDAQHPLAHGCMSRIGQTCNGRDGDRNDVFSIGS